jgi:hypothetical protein
MPEENINLHYREGELENLLNVRNGFVDLIEKYSIELGLLNRSRMLGSIFDTVFFIGICNLREHMPSVKEVYLNIGESRNRSLRNLELLEEMKVVLRVHDTNDSRVKRISLTDTFRSDFDVFVEKWIDSRKPPIEAT